MRTSTLPLIKDLPLDDLTRKERKRVETWLNGEMPPNWLQPKDDPWGTLVQLNALWEWEAPTAESTPPDTINETDPLLPKKLSSKSRVRLGHKRKRPQDKTELAKLGKEIAPWLMLLILERQNEENRRFRRPEYKDTIDEANRNTPTPKQDPSTTKNVFFRFFCFIISILGTSEGAVGGYELVKYLGDITNHNLGTAMSISFAVVFALISLGIVTAVDLSFVANSMGVSYLTACQELKSIAKDAKEIQNLLEELEIMLKGIKSELNQRSLLEEIIDELNKKHKNAKSEKQPDLIKELEARKVLLEGLKSIDQLNEELKTCKKLFDALQSKAATCETRFLTYKKGFDETRVKRSIFRFSWILLTALIYAGSANLTAMNVLGLASVFTPIGIGISIAVATLWICVELFRFYNFERKNIASAMDVVFGTSSSAYCDAADSVKNSRRLNYSNADEFVNHQVRIDYARAKKKAETTPAANDASDNRNSFFSVKPDKAAEAGPSQLTASK